MTCTGADELKHSRPLPISDGNLPRQPGCKAEREIAQITSRCLLRNRLSVLGFPRCMEASAADVPAILPKHTARGARLPRCRVTGMNPSQSIIVLRATSCINRAGKFCDCSDVTMGFRDTHRLIGELTVLPLRRAPTGLAAFPCQFYCRKTKRLRRSKAHRRCVMRTSLNPSPCL